MALANDDRTLYIANLHKNVTEELLYELFLQAGPVDRVSIPAANNRNFRYGFVTYLHECSIDYAIQLYKGTTLFKKELVIKKKGEKSNVHQQVKNKYAECTSSLDISHDLLANTGHDFYHTSPNKYPEKPSVNVSNLIENSLKGQWSNRNKPYSRNTARKYHSSKSQEFRNWHQSKNHQKSFRNRKGNYLHSRNKQFN